MFKNAVLIILASSSLLAGSIQYTWRSSCEDVRLDSFGAWDVIGIDGGMPVFGNGYPNLPAVPRCYVIPQGMTATGVEVSNVSTVSMGGSLLPVPVMLLPLSSDAPAFPNYTEACFEDMSGSFSFPASSIAGFKTGTKTGFRLASYSFVPFVYSRQTGELLYITSADINLLYQPDPGVGMNCLTERQVELAKRGISTFVDNPEMLDAWAPLQRSSTDEDVDVIIVGYDQQSAQLGELQTLHNTLGYSCEIVTVQWIMANVDGYDVTEKIRNFIKELYENNGLLFALIVGDRGATTRLSQLDFPYWVEAMNSTADLYFSDLDGTWDDNGNHLYGEEFDGMDYYSDIYVGRYPTAVNETDDLNAMIEKYQQYNTAPEPGDWQTRALLLGAVLFPTPPVGPWCFGSKYCDSLAAFFPVDWEWDPLYEDTTGYHPDNQLELFNQGTAITAYAAHGSGNGFCWYYPYGMWPSILDVSSILNMNNGGKLPWILGSMSCTTGSLVNDGFAEMIVERQGGGGVVIVASSNGTFGGITEPGPGGWFAIYFAHVLFDQDLVTAGVAHGISKDMFWANWNSFYIPRMAEWSLQALNLYGDPCTVFVGAPEGVESGPQGQFLSRVSPNPVCGTMSVSVTLGEPSAVKLLVFDASGRVVLSCEDGPFSQGEHSLTMDASSLPTGIYMISAVAGNQVSTTKCVVLR